MTNASFWQLQGFHAEREQRGLTGYGAAHAPRGPPTQIGPAGVRMLQAGLGGGAAVAPPMHYGRGGGPPQPQLGPPGPYANGGYGGRGGGGYGGPPQQQQPGGYNAAPPHVYGGSGGGRSGFGGRGGGGGLGMAPIAAQQPAFQQAAPGAYQGGRPRPGSQPAYSAQQPAYQQGPLQQPAYQQGPPPQQYGGEPALMFSPVCCLQCCLSNVVVSAQPSV